MTKEQFQILLSLEELDEQIDYIIESDFVDTKFYDEWSTAEYSPSYLVDYYLSQESLLYIEDHTIFISAKKWRNVLVHISLNELDEAVKLGRSVCELCHYYLCYECPWYRVTGDTCKTRLEQFKNCISLEELVHIAIGILETLKIVDREVTKNEY